ncbi:glycosyltransferase family 39 protein [Actinoplanes sp. TBRC 11911]|uniref:glycosyltransferase family 39 protein n=1 Tax=Actinoplanes sp. TBRC 11911 TaxID=2729386 RepID=UPI00145CD1E8|nr:glycosyltransferase family 39 protein [Actinoplanes sp. TBRC 11911]NMO54901.1 glycosyltransferase family 39 protein [Actinoplanes sp. TBRC 11911]
MTTTLPVPPLVVPQAPPPTRRWIRPALGVLLLLTGVLYLWGLGKNGWANSFYSAAVQAGSVSWKAFFFGSSDAANSITVDKTPASLWVMALSARVFGVNAWSILVPQALMGVASVGLLFTSVRRWFGPAAGLLAGLVLALTPIAALMFRFNNPDALLVLLMVAGAYATTRAIENGSTKWIMLAGVFVGFGFLAKMLQALLVVPAFALAYLFAGPPKLGKRIWQLLLSGLAVVVSAGWYIAIVSLVPASMRPYIGGSQNNSLLELALGYNGLGRLSGDETGSVGGGGGGGGGGGFWGSTGLLRMFAPEQGGQVAWLLPAALILLVAGLVITFRRVRTDRQRAGLILWGSWLLVTGLTFSFMQGIFHAYYTVALAPAIGALVGMGAAVLWRHRRHWAAAVTLAVAIAVTAWWSYVLLARSADFLPWLKWVVLVGGLLAAVAVLGSLRLPTRVGAVAAGLALIFVLAGPAAYAVQTVSQPHTGSIPSAGPATDAAFGPGGGRGFGGGRGGGGFGGGRGQNGTFPGFPGGTQNGGGFPGGSQNGGGFAGGAQNGGGFPGLPGGSQNGGLPGGSQNGGGFRGGGGMGGLLDSASVSAEMKALLLADADKYTWVAASVGSQNASGYQLATGKPVMPVGGFNGSDPSPTLAQFQEYVAQGKIHYFIGGAGFGGRSAGGSNASAQIAEWVQANFTAKTVGNTTVYDLTAPTTNTTA